MTTQSWAVNIQPTKLSTNQAINQSIAANRLPLVLTSKRAPAQRDHFDAPNAQLGPLSSARRGVGRQRRWCFLWQRRGLRLQRSLFQVTQLVMSLSLQVISLVSPSCQNDGPSVPNMQLSELPWYFGRSGTKHWFFFLWNWECPDRNQCPHLAMPNEWNLTKPMIKLGMAYRFGVTSSKQQTSTRNNTTDSQPELGFCCPQLVGHAY